MVGCIPKVIAHPRSVTSSTPALQAILDRTTALVTAARAKPELLPPAEHKGAYRLRTALAVRGWVNPHHLLPPSEFSRSEAAEALNDVAGEVETSFTTRPGAWFLSVDSRKRVLASRSREILQEELRADRWEGDANDPIRRAFCLALALEPLPALASLEDEVLRALKNALQWLGPAALLSINSAEIAAAAGRL